MKMKKLSAYVLPIIALVGFVVSGCSQESKTARHLAKANQYYQAGNYDAAEIEYKNVLKADAQNLEAIKRLGMIYADQGRVMRGHHLLSIARRQNTNDLDVRLRLAQLWVDDGRNKEAREETLFIIGRSTQHLDAFRVLALSADTTNRVQEIQQFLEQARQRYGDKSEFQVALGVLGLRLKNFKAAQAAFQKALALDPASAEASFGLGNACWRLNDVAGAGQAFEKAASLAPIRSGKALRYALFKLETGAPGEAKKMIEEIIRQARDYLPAQRVLAGILVNERKFEESSPIVKEILSREPTDYEALILQSRIELAQRKPAAAVITLTRLASFYTNSAQAWLHLGVAQLANNEPAKAVENLRHANRLAPSLLDPILLLAKQDIRRGDTASAIASLLPLTKNEPPIPQAFMLLAEAYLAARSSSEALGVYQRMQELYPNAPEPAIQMASVLLQSNRVSEARQVLDKATQAAPDNLQLLDMLVNLDIREKAFPQAMQRVQRILDKDPKAVGPLLLQGHIYHAQANYPQAEAVLKKVTELSPGNRYACKWLAEIYIATHREQEALTQLQTQVAKQTNDWLAWIMIGTIQDRLKRYSEAAQAYEKALVLAPANIETLNNLAYLYSEKLDQLEKGFQMAQKAIALDPDNPAVVDTMAWILCQRGEYDRALALALECAPKLQASSEAQYHLAMAHYMVGEEAPARSAFEKALQSTQDFPGRSDAERRLAFLKIDPEKTDMKSIQDMEKRAADLPGRPGGDPVVLARVAGMSEKTGAFRQACDAYEKALKLNPKALAIRLKLAQLYFERLNDPKRALEQAKEARTLAPENPDIAHFVGRLAFLAGDHQWASSVLLQSAQKLPQKPEVLYHLAQAQFSLGEIEDAKNSLNGALSSNVAFKEAPSARRMLEFMGYYTNTAEMGRWGGRVQEVLKTEPNDAVALAAAARMADQPGAQAAAKQAYEKMLNQYPLFAPAIRRLAVLCSETSSDDKTALEWALKARKAFPNDPDVAKALGVAELKRGDYARSTQLLKESARARTNDGEVFFYLGMAQYRAKETKDATNNLRRALSLNLRKDLADEANRALTSIR